ncbi:hypothetical protein ACVFVO_19380 [Advenella kashmirensis]
MRKPIPFSRTRKQKDELLKQLINNTYESVQVVGRGTINIDPKEVRNSENFKQALSLAKSIVGA